MQNETTNSTRSGLKWGIIVGVISIIIGLVTQIFELWKISWVGWLSMVLMIVMVVLAIRDHKNLNKGFLSIGEGVNIGAITGAISGLLSGIFNFVYTTFIDTNMPQKIKDFTTEKLVEQGMSEEQIEKVLEMTEKFSASPGTSFIIGLIVTVIGMAFTGLIVGAIMKKEKSVFE